LKELKATLPGYDLAVTGSVSGERSKVLAKRAGNDTVTKVGAGLQGVTIRLICPMMWSWHMVAVNPAVRSTYPHMNPT